MPCKLVYESSDVIFTIFPLSLSISYSVLMVAIGYISV